MSHTLNIYLLVLYFPLRHFIFQSSLKFFPKSQVESDGVQCLLKLLNVLYILNAVVYTKHQLQRIPG